MTLRRDRREHLREYKRRRRADPAYRAQEERQQRARREAARAKGNREVKENHGGDRHTAAARLTAAQRADEALQLRLRRLPYREIARRLGYASPSGAWKAVEREIAKVPRENAKQLLTEELEALDALQREVMPAALGAGPTRDGSPKAPDLWAIDRVLSIMDRRARLMRLDKIEGDSGVDEFKAVLAAWAVTIARQVDDDDKTSVRHRVQDTEGIEESK